MYQKLYTYQYPVVSIWPAVDNERCEKGECNQTDHMEVEVWEPGVIAMNGAK